MEQSIYDLGFNDNSKFEPDYVKMLLNYSHSFHFEPVYDIIYLLRIPY